jgi:hypothetical protein
MCSQLVANFCGIYLNDNIVWQHYMSFTYIHIYIYIYIQAKLLRSEHLSVCFGSINWLEINSFSNRSFSVFATRYVAFYDVRSAVTYSHILFFDSFIWSILCIRIRLRRVVSILFEINCMQCVANELKLRTLLAIRA